MCRPSSRRASPRQRSSWAAWSLGGCRGCALAGRGSRCRGGSSAWRPARRGGDGGQDVEVVQVSGEAPSGASVERPKKLKPTNHMRPSGGGAFPLPSIDWVRLHHNADAQPCAKARQKTVQAGRAHGRPLRSDVGANNPLDSGARDVGLVAFPSAGACCACPLDDGRDSIEADGVCGTNRGAEVQAGAMVAAMLPRHRCEHGSMRRQTLRRKASPREAVDRLRDGHRSDQGRHCRRQ